MGVWEGCYLDRVVVESLSGHSSQNLKQKEPAWQGKDYYGQIEQHLGKPCVGQ